MGYINFKVPSNSICIYRNGEQIILNDGEVSILKDIGSYVIDKKISLLDIRDAFIIKRNTEHWKLTDEEINAIYEYLDALHKNLADKRTRALKSFSYTMIHRSLGGKGIISVTTEEEAYRRKAEDPDNVDII